MDMKERIQGCRGLSSGLACMACIISVFIAAGCGQNRQEEFSPRAFPAVTVPGIYADDRDSLRSYLAEHGISSTVYWPRIPESDVINEFDILYPGASFIYDHVCSIQIDQRYGKWEMEYLASVLTGYSR